MRTRLAVPEDASGLQSQLPNATLSLIHVARCLPVFETVLRRSASMSLMPASRGWNKIPVAGGASCRLFSVCGKTLRFGCISSESTGPQAAFQDRPVTGPPCQWAAGTGVPGNWQIEAPAPGRGPENPDQHGAGSESWAAGRGAMASWCFKLAGSGKGRPESDGRMLGARRPAPQCEQQAELGHWHWQLAASITGTGSGT